MTNNESLGESLWSKIQNRLKPHSIDFTFTSPKIVFGLLDETSPEIINTKMYLGKILVFK